jgi:hypothetical protein
MMAHIFSFAILKAVPDARRGERVNVGMIIFMPDKIDMRFSEIGKIRALREGNWDDYLANVRHQLMRIFVPGDDPAQFLRRASVVEDVVRFTDPAAFSIERPEQYEERVKAILTALVTRPRGESKTRTPQINSEIARTFRMAKILAKATDSIDEGRKVFPNYPISDEEELSADFILKNGLYHVTVTLDLRRVSVNKAQAALKAVVLDKSSHVLVGGVQKIAVYAASDAQQYRPHIGILTDYSDSGQVYNWLDPEQRERYTRATYDAISGPLAFQLGGRPN